ncbi:hypothetical protein RF11_01913 [Thelohanellus kitauei]|uniref:Kelch domain-containing protein 10 n=1 Tax=Thelohanellus kitauei TaxID=669202 RepID=A0A0C2MYG1_THEKT|nr:hypothetical protein RF11_01913 [Thelohanellus kitauei]
MALNNLETIIGSRVSFNLSSTREFLIVSGGKKQNNRTYYDEILVHNTISGVSKRYKSPFKMKYFPISMICSAGNKVYMCCMKTHTHGCPNIISLISFDVTNARWENLYSHTENYCVNETLSLDLDLFFYHNESLYAFGLYCGQYNSEEEDNSDEPDTSGMYKFCLKTSKWSIVKQIGESRIFDGMTYGTVFKNQLIVFNTLLGPTKKFREVKIFDFSTNAWSTRATTSKNKQYPPYQRTETYAFSSTCVYMTGGCKSSDPLSNTGIWRMDLESMEWTRMDYFVKTVAFRVITCVVDDTYLYSFSMICNDSPKPTTLELFTLQPPSLYRLCLESVYRSPNMTRYIGSLPMAILDDLKISDDDTPAYA